MLSQETSLTLTMTKQFKSVYCDILVYETNTLSSSKDEQEKRRAFCIVNSKIFRTKVKTDRSHCLSETLFTATTERSFFFCFIY